MSTSVSYNHHSLASFWVGRPLIRNTKCIPDKLTLKVEPYRRNNKAGIDCSVTTCNKFLYKAEAVDLDATKRNLIPAIDSSPIYVDLIVGLLSEEIIYAD